ncbi:MAG: aminotransferase class V-fold PLP-dependent enzyme [Vicinamibacterales bacterium]|nr:aminotransferase class V-fold PLP-dependent enzyme [Vicinamibacterales bacterium]
MDTDELLMRTAEIARAYNRDVGSRRVGASATADDLRRTLGGPLPDTGVEPMTVIDEFARGAEPGLTATSGPRFFGFVIGGSLPAALAAEWLATTWDQNCGIHVCSPAAAVVEEIVSGWLLDLLDLPRTSSVGFVTGGQMANFTCLAAARHEVLRRAGWSVEDDGLGDAPAVRVVTSTEAHTTVFAALSMLGLGRRRAVQVATDAQGRMRPDALAEALAGYDGPTIVSAQAGNVNTGAVDPLQEIAEIAHDHGAWLHVDGAFGLWGRASAQRRDQVVGAEFADSWAVDAHKWLNVPYDSGLAIVAHPDAHRAAMTVIASYLVEAGASVREPHWWVPESSRRGRGFAIYAALRSLGQDGVAALVDRCCDHAARIAMRLGQEPDITVLNDIVLNQALVQFTPRGGGDADAFTQAVIDRVQADGTCYLSGAVWHDMKVMRISVSNWSTTEADMDRLADAILRAIELEDAALSAP